MRPKTGKIEDCEKHGCKDEYDDQAFLALFLSLLFGDLRPLQCLTLDSVRRFGPVIELA